MPRIILFALSVFALATASAPPGAKAAIIGTAGGDIVIFQGQVQTLNTTITNPFSGKSIALNGSFNVNATTYDGLGGEDIMLMTNLGDALFLDDGGTPTVANMEVFIAGNGNDVINLASATFSPGSALNLNGGRDDDILWANIGNDIVVAGPGNDIVDAGPGNDIIVVVDGNDTIDAGLGDDLFQFLGAFGTDTVLDRGGFDEIQLSGLSLTDLLFDESLNGDLRISVASAADEIFIPGQFAAGSPVIEQLRFDDGSTFALQPGLIAVPEPGSLVLFGIGLAALAVVRGKKSARPRPRRRSPAM